MSVPKSRLKTRRLGRPRKKGPSLLPKLAASAVPSLPPAPPEPTQASPTSEKLSPRGEPWWKLRDDSTCRETAIRILSLRTAGLEDAEIAKALNMSVKSISPYVYRAGKN